MDFIMKIFHLHLMLTWAFETELQVKLLNLSDLSKSQMTKDTKVMILLNFYVHVF